MKEQSRRYHEIVEVRYLGQGWWEIVLDCAHRAKVLLGAVSPLHDRVVCFHCEHQVKEVQEEPEVIR